VFIVGSGFFRQDALRAGGDVLQELSSVRTYSDRREVVGGLIVVRGTAGEGAVMIDYVVAAAAGGGCGDVEMTERRSALLGEC